MALPSGTKNSQTLGAAGVPITLADGTTAYALMTVPVDTTGTPSSGSSTSNTYSLANAAASLAAGANTTPITIPANASASYGFSYIFGGTSPSLKLQALGADGTTWQDVVTVTASGQQGVVIFAGAGGAQLRLLNAGANAITGLTATLAS